MIEPQKQQFQEDYRFNGVRQSVNFVDQNPSVSGTIPNIINEPINPKSILDGDVLAQLNFSGSNLISAHFRKGFSINGISIYVSDGTSPNTKLTGKIGDFCLNGSGGHPFYCTGTTNWTQI